MRSSLAQQSLPALRPMSDWMVAEKSPVPRAAHVAAKSEAEHPNWPMLFIVISRSTYHLFETLVLLSLIRSRRDHIWKHMIYLASWCIIKLCDHMMTK